MYNAISSLYWDPQARIVLNDIPTDYFKCILGTKQGDCLSRALFSIFISDLSVELKQSGINLDLGDSKDDADDKFCFNHFLYADDLISIADSEEKLQQ
jgi:hypothetical protein